MNTKNTYLEKDEIKREFIRFMSTMPHNSSLCALFVDLMTNKARKEDRPELLQFVIENLKYTYSNHTYFPSSCHKIDIGVPVLLEYRDKVRVKIKKIVSSSWETETKSKEEFYKELDSFIFENPQIVTMHQKAYVLFLCTKNKSLPYCSISKQELNIIDRHRCIEQEVGIAKAMKLNFILNHPAMNYLEKTSLLNTVIESVPIQSRDLVMEHIVEFYETELKTERLTRQVERDIQLLKKTPKMPVGYSTKNLPRKKKISFWGKVKKRIEEVTN